MLSYRVKKYLRENTVLLRGNESNLNICLQKNVAPMCVEYAVTCQGSCIRRSTLISIISLPIFIDLSANICLLIFDDIL